MAEKLIRGNVAKYEAMFIQFIREHGAETVKKVLTHGKWGKFKLTVPLNKKDRFQMLQLLGLVEAKNDNQIT